MIEFIDGQLNFLAEALQRKLEQLALAISIMFPNDGF